MPVLTYIAPQAPEHPRAEAPHLPGILRMTPRHDAILEAILAEPDLPMGALAQRFGVTATWLSLIIHSDCFQARLAEAQTSMFGEVRASVKDRLQALAHRSLERLSERIELEQETARITDAAELALKALGFMGQAVGRAPGNITQINNFGAVDRSTLAAARQMMERRQGAIYEPTATSELVEISQG